MNEQVCRTILACLVGGMLTVSVAFATTLAELLETIQDERESAEEAMTEAIAAMQTNDLDSAVAQLGNAASAFENLTTLLSDTNNLATLGKSGPKLAKSLTSLRNGVNAVVVEANEVDADSTKLSKAISKLSARSGKLTKTLLTAGAGNGPVILEEVKAKSAGFHDPNQTVWFTIHGLSQPSTTPCTNVSVQIENPYNIAVFPVVYGDPCLGSFHVIMGTNAGPASVVITVNGHSSTRLLYNHGPAPDSGGGGGGSNTTTNNWSGNWTATGPGLCAGSAGSWTATIIDNNGSLSGSWQAPGWGNGVVSGNASSVTFGGGGSGVTFMGAMSGNNVSGNFSTNEDCYDQYFNYVGNAYGTFSGGKN